MHLNFGYPWWLSYGHLIVTALAGYLLMYAFARRLSLAPKILIAAITLWSLAAFGIMRFVIDLNGRAAMPTQNFLRSGEGLVLDIGAGTGRSSIMILEARPKTTLVALDLFGESFNQHFGRSQSPQDRLFANLRAAGVDKRVTIETGDMRKLPFPTDTFDGIVSSYAMDHLNRAGIIQALAEAARVTKPNGEFLLVLVGKEPWIQFAFGPLLTHAGTRPPGWWNDHLQEAGFQVVEQGTRPGTLYMVSRKPALPKV